MPSRSEITKRSVHNNSSLPLFEYFDLRKLLQWILFFTFTLSGCCSDPTVKKVPANRRLVSSCFCGYPCLSSRSVASKKLSTRKHRKTQKYCLKCRVIKRLEKKGKKISVLATWGGFSSAICRVAVIDGNPLQRTPPVVAFANAPVEFCVLLDGILCQLALNPEEMFWEE